MNYQTLTPELIEQLSAIAPGRVFAGADINEDYAHDEMAIYGKRMPDAVVEALTTEEIAAVMKLCNENKIPDDQLAEELLTIFGEEYFK